MVEFFKKISGREGGLLKLFFVKFESSLLYKKTLLSFFEKKTFFDNHVTQKNTGDQNK